MQLKIEKCSCCEKTRPIVNRKYLLCNECNGKRLHNDTDQKEDSSGSERPRTVLKRTPIKRKVYKIKQITTRKAKVRKELGLVKAAVESRDCGICLGCAGIGGDKSHILSIAQHQALELMEENIQLLCRECHMKWESWNVEKMTSLLCFEDNMRFIETHSTSTFYRVCYKIKEYLESQRTCTAVVESIQQLYFYAIIKNL